MDGGHTQVFTVIDQMPAADARGLREHRGAAAGAAGLRRPERSSCCASSSPPALAQPQIVVDLMLDQIAAQRRPPASDSPLLAALQAVPGDDRRRPTSSGCAAQAIAAYEQQFVPSWQRLETVPARHLPPEGASADRAHVAAGWTQAATTRLCATHTTTSMTAERDPRARPAGGGAHRARDGADRPGRRLHRPGDRVRTGAGASGRACGSTSQDEMIAYARETSDARRAGAAAAVHAPAEDGGRHPADSAGPRGVDGVQLRGRHGRRHAAGLVQHEHLPARRSR